MLYNSVDTIFKRSGLLFNNKHSSCIFHSVRSTFTGFEVHSSDGRSPLSFDKALYNFFETCQGCYRIKYDKALTSHKVNCVAPLSDERIPPMKTAVA